WPEAPEMSANDPNPTSARLKSRSAFIGARVPLSEKARCSIQKQLRDPHSDHLREHPHQLRVRSAQGPSIDSKIPEEGRLVDALERCICYALWACVLPSR